MAQTKIKLSKQAFVDDNFDFNAKILSNLATPLDENDAVTKGYADNLLAANDALVYKGAIDCSTNPNFPAASAGHTYKVEVNGKIGGTDGIVVYIGDTIICTQDNTLTGDLAAVGTYWNVLHTSSEGNVIGPASATSNAVSIYNGTTGKIIKNSLVTIDASGSVNIPTDQNYKINGSAITTANIADSTNARYVTDAHITLLGNTSGTNSGDNAVNSLYSSLITNATHTGAVTGSDELTITDKAVTLAKMADMATASFIGRNTASAGVPEVLSTSTVKTMLSLGSAAYTDSTAYATATQGATADSAIQKSVLNANSVLYATTDDVPAALEVASSTLVGRKATGDVTALTTSEIRSLLNIADGSNVGVVPNAAITGATKTKITYDEKGLVTAGVDATTADIADSSDRRYVTDANITLIGNTSGVNTGDETVSRIGTLTNSATAKATLADDDKFVINDSAASGVMKTSLWSIIKSTLKTYFMGLYVCREVPSGTQNGTNVDFTLANAPVAGTEMIFLNGLLQHTGASNDYSISSNTITFTVAPLASDTILVTYWK